MSKNHSRPLILLVDDIPSNIRVLIEVLQQDYELGVTNSGPEALKYAQKFLPDLILLDILMPEIDGYEVCTQLKSSDQTKDIPVIFITSLNETKDKTKGFEIGVVDYITRPFEPIEVRARVKTHLTLKQARELLSDQNRTLEKMVGKRTSQLHEVLDLSLLINNERDLTKIFEMVIPHVRRIIEADRASLFLADHQEKKLWTKAAEGLSIPITLPWGKGLVGKTASTGKPVIVNDALNHPDFDNSWDQKTGYITKNILCYPVLSRNGKLKGVLEVINKLSGKGFSDTDLSLAATCASQIGGALETYDLLTELSFAFESFARTLAITIEAKHPLTAGHSVRVTEYSLMIGRALGLSNTELEVLNYVGLLHDVGKIGVPDQVLTKKGLFKPNERTVMNQHAVWTGRILEAISMPRALKGIAKMAACHHEKIDGTGYPYNLRGEKIPYLSRIICVSDVFDALTSKRDYPKYDGDQTFGFDPLTIDKAFSILDQGKGSHFDTDILNKTLTIRPDLVSLWQHLHSSKDQMD